MPEPDQDKNKREPLSWFHLLDSWLVAAACFLFFFLMGYASPRFAEIYKDMGTRLRWPSNLIPWIHWQWTSVVGLALAALLVWKDHRLPHRSANGCNIGALILLVLLAIFWVVSAFKPMMYLRGLISG